MLMTPVPLRPDCLDRQILTITAVLLVSLATPAALAVDIYILDGSSEYGDPCDKCLSPSDANITAGEAAVWYNRDTVRHTITSGSGSPDDTFHSGLVSPGESFSFTPSDPGQYPYYCVVHPWIQGTVYAAAEAPRLLSRINDPLDVELYVVSGEQYAVFTRFADSAVETLAVSNLEMADLERGGAGRLAGLDGPQEVEILRDGERRYALVAAYLGDAIHVVNVTDPTRMVQVAAIRNGTGGFDALGGARDVVVHYATDGAYAYATAAFDRAIQIVNFTDPARPTPAGTLEDTTIVFSPLDVSVLDISGVPHLLVTGTGEVAARIMDISDPINPVQVGTVAENHTAYAALSGSADVQNFAGPEGVYIVVADTYGNAITILNITDPTDPVVVGAAQDGEDGFGALVSPSDIELFQMSGKTYALVTGSWDNAIQVINITNPARPVTVANITGETEGFVIYNPWDAEIPLDGTRALVVGSNGNVLQTISFEDPANPAVVGTRSYDPVEP